MSKKPEIPQGTLIIVSAPSGGGKTTVVDRILKRHPEWTRSISVTTRQPRVGEKSGGDYFFVDDAEFTRMQENSELLESARVFDQSYGTPRKFVLDNLKEGKKVVLAIDVQGMKKVVNQHKESMDIVTIFILPPSMKVLRERLEGRKTDSVEEIERRIGIAQDEIKAAKLYDFTVMNQNIEKTVLEIESFIEKKDKERREKSHAIRST